MKKKRKSPSAIIAIPVLAVALTVIIYLFTRTSSPLVKKLVIEAGSGVPTASDFFINPNAAGEFVTDISQINMHTVAEYEIEIKLENKKYKSKLSVSDTVPPAASVLSCAVLPGAPLEPAGFVSDVFDETMVSVRFAKNPDFNKAGTRDVGVILTDEGGNQLTLTASLTVLTFNKDITFEAGQAITPSDFIKGDAPESLAFGGTEPPDFATPGEHEAVLTLNGSSASVKYTITDTTSPVISGEINKSISMGESAAFRAGVTVTDNSGEIINLSINADSVDTSVPGVYSVIYTAADSSGNEASVTGTLIVRDVIEDEVYAQADEILSGIINAEQTDREKAMAIFDWIRAHVSYTQHGEKESPVRGAYNAFTLKTGDCYTFYAAGEILLTRAGVTNRPITRFGGETRHYWSLIFIEDGWYHYDPTPHKDHLDNSIFTESRAKELTALRGNNYYVYEEALYPEIVN